jgi:hypothetical protein
VNESGVTVTQIGRQNISQMVAVYGTPWAIPSCNSNMLLRIIVLVSEVSMTPMMVNWWQSFYIYVRLLTFHAVISYYGSKR